MSFVRSIAVWFPDWPVTAFGRERGTPVDTPVAVVEHNEVVACSPAARAEGVRRGLRRRDAQARCPSLEIVPSDPARDWRAFAPIVTRIEQLAPGVQPIRPGLCVLRARGPARYYGGEDAAARVVLDGLGAVDGLDPRLARAGVADGPFAAEQAARVAEPVHVIAPGASGEFLASWPVAILRDASTAGADAELPNLLVRLGVHTLGAFAALEPDRVRDRFGEQGLRLHALASGRDTRPVVPRVPPPELHREIAFEPPLELAEQVAFGMRIAAEEFVAKLGSIDLVCTELRVELTGERGERSERVWLHPGSFDAAAVVDRVRWQLAEDAQGEVLRSGVALVRIAPEAVDPASAHRPAIFGAGPEEKVHHALSRVQAMLGHRGVVTPAIGGGRWLSERQVLVPWGDRAVLARERARPWPGSLPRPLPTTVFPEPRPAAVVDEEGITVDVDDRGALTGIPAELTESGRTRAVRSWAGPWSIAEREWDAERRRVAHRFQVVDTDQTAWLLLCEQGQWAVEARYD